VVEDGIVRVLGAGTLNQRRTVDARTLAGVEPETIRKVTRGEPRGTPFFVREAYFTGAGDAYASLRRALRADIDEAVWSMLYQTESRPFPPPDTGKIAVKVINHYGDEVMKVYEVV
jgi:hypothetical protein